MTRAGYYSNYLTATDGRPTAWHVEEFHQTGHLITTMDGTKLCRVAPGFVYFWDKRAKAEVQMSIDALVKLCS